MKPTFFCITLLCFFAIFYTSTEVLAQKKQPTDPKIGYLYPAGGQQGTTFLMLVGGRQITRSSHILFSGQGIRGRVVQDTLALHVNDANERRLVLQLYLDALKKLEGVSVPQKRFDKIEDKPSKSTQAAASPDTKAPMPTVEDVSKKYPYVNRLATNPTTTDLELVYYYYFSPKIDRKPLDEILNRGVLLEITIAPDAEPGDRDFRLLGPAGMTPPMRFVVGVHPEIREQEPNSADPEDLESTEEKWRDVIIAPKSIKNRSPLELPIVINGQIRAGDMDIFQFQATRGQKIVIDVQARHLKPYLADGVPGWFQAAISLFGPDGQKIDEAMSYQHEPDPMLFIEIPETGIYSLEIQDSLFRGRDDFVYRITVAESPLVTSVFPLGGTQGRSQKINLTGWNLRENSFLFHAEKNEKEWKEVSQINKTRLARPIRLASDDLPEKNEIEPNNNFNQAEKLQQPIIVNGWIADEKDTDIFSFEGRKGSQIVLDVTARSLGSPLDAMLELRDAAENLIASSDDRADASGPNIGLETHHADPYLSVELPADGRYFVRLYDVAQKGGEAFAYRLRISQPQPDFSVFCAPSTVVFRESTYPLKVHLIRKDGFEGDICLRPVNSQDIQIENGQIVSGTDEATVKLLALPRYSGGVREIALEAVAVIDGKEVVRPVLPVDDWEQAFIYHHWVPAKSLVVAQSRTDNEIRRRPNLPPPRPAPRPTPASTPTPEAASTPMPTAPQREEAENTSSENPLVRELNVTQLQYRGTGGQIDYCQAVENKEIPGEMSLVLILHGRSGGGNDNVSQLTSPALKPLLNFVKVHKQQTVVIVPQCPSDRDWVRGGYNSPLAVVHDLVKQKCKEFNVSAERVYVTGVSMGGGACYDLQSRAPGMFAKAIVVSAGGRPEEAVKMKGDFYIVHGANDQLIPVKRAIIMAEAIRKNKEATVKFISLPNKGHIDAAFSAYSEACWHWLFQ